MEYRIHTARGIKQLWHLATTLCFIAILMFGGLIQAQESAAPSAVPSLVVVPERPVEAIGKDIENASVSRTLAIEHRTMAESRLKAIEPALNATKDRIKNLDHQKNLAKKGKRESEVMSFEAEKRAAGQVANLYSKLKDVRKAEVEAAEAEVELAEVTERAYQLELELAKKRSERDALILAGASGLERTSSLQVTGDLEAQLLKLQEQQANATKKVADKAKDIVNRRMKLFKEKTKLGDIRI